jgi:hypothetical protein
MFIEDNNFCFKYQAQGAYEKTRRSSSWRSFSHLVVTMATGTTLVAQLISPAVNTRYISALNAGDTTRDQLRTAELCR